MNHWIRVLGKLLLLTTLGVTGIANAKLVGAKLGLTPTHTACDVAKSTYKYVATWKAPAGSQRFQVNTGNQCRLDGRICGIQNKDCIAVTCNTVGECSAPLDACVIGKGAAWVQVIALDASVFQRVRAPKPAMPVNCN